MKKPEYMNSEEKEKRKEKKNVAAEVVIKGSYLGSSRQEERVILSLRETEAKGNGDCARSQS